MNRILNGDVTKHQWQRNIFILDFRFLSISVNVVVLCVVIIIYLYLFSRINDSCMASPFIQRSKNTYFYWVICYYHAVIRNSSCQGTKKLNPWKMAVPGANFAGKHVGSKGLREWSIESTMQFTWQFSTLEHMIQLSTPPFMLPHQKIRCHKSPPTAITSNQQVNHWRWITQPGAIN